MTPSIYSDLEALLRIVTTDIRQRLADANIGHLRLDIEVTGRTMLDGAEISFIVGNNYSADNPRGGNLNAVIEEFLRRHSWKERNKPQLLAAPSTASDDEIPF